MKNFLKCLIICVFFVGCGQSDAVGLRNGDIIFQTSLSSQSRAIELATHSQYSHVGMVLIKEGKPYVFEAIGVVTYTPLEEWIRRGSAGAYVVKRLRNRDSILTGAVEKQLFLAAESFKGRPYDLYFNWSDDRIYCSELVWKIYHKAVGLSVGRLQNLGEFDFSHSIVRAKLKERYGDNIPMDEKVISPAAMFQSDLLTTVKQVS